LETKAPSKRNTRGSHGFRSWERFGNEVEFWANLMGEYVGPDWKAWGEKGIGAQKGVPKSRSLARVQARFYIFPVLKDRQG